MANEDGRVTLLPQQIRRLADLAEESPSAIEVKQKGSTLYFNNGQTRIMVNAAGNDVNPPNQESFC